MEKALLAIKEVDREHKGKNLALYIMEVIKSWELSQKLGYIVIDNAPNNDVIIQFILEGLF